ncbi:MAG: phage holin family protein [Thermoleophilaceae bacterium]|nr:phage holin family protein [Thermoleophilaceae bacterium]
MSATPPPGPADKSLGDIVQEVSEKAQLLVREEIELAKTEVITKATKLGKGAAIGAVAGVAAFFALIFFLQALAWFFNDLFNVETSIWLGFLIVFLILVALGAIAGFVAYKFIQGGSPPTPDLAIEEAKLTQKTIEDARSAPAPGEVAEHREAAAQADTSDVKKESGPKPEVKAAKKAGDKGA